MFVRKAILALSLSAVMVPMAFASSASFETGGEDSLRFKSSQSTKSRAEVRAEFLASRQAGTLPATGESGETPLARHSYSVQNGKLVHTHRLSHDAPRTSAVRSGADLPIYQGS